MDPRMEIEVITGVCEVDHTGKYICRGAISRTRGTYTSAERALAHNAHCRAVSVYVVVRPMYNEVDVEGKRFFREWRSFEGGDWSEARWYF